jgi:hypothetical protein
VADKLSDRIRSLGYNPSYSVKSFCDRIDETLALITKEGTPSTATLILFGQACERLKWEAADIDAAVRKDASARFDIAGEVECLCKTNEVKTDKENP